MPNSKIIIVGGLLSYVAVISFILRAVYKVSRGAGLDYYHTGFGVQFNYIGALIVLFIVFLTLAITIIINIITSVLKFWLISHKGDSMAKKNKGINEIKSEIRGWSFWGKTAIILSLAVISVISIGAVLWGIPKYRVYRMELEGKARLRQAEWTKKIAIETARAEKEAAKLKAEAEVERAKGVSAANKIIGESLKNNEAYLRYLWIQGLQDGSSEVIYIPTEAGLPILEAGRRPEPKQK